MCTLANFFTGECLTPEFKDNRYRLSCKIDTVPLVEDQYIIDLWCAKGHEVYAIHPNALVIDALRRMAEHNVGSLVVIENHKLVGIITERHYARQIALKGRTSARTAVRDIMSKRVACVRADQSVEECMMIMNKRSVSHLPVLDHGCIVGIVSIGAT